MLKAYKMIQYEEVNKAEKYKMETELLLKALNVSKDQISYEMNAKMQEIEQGKSEDVSEDLDSVLQRNSRLFISLLIKMRQELASLKVDDPKSLEEKKSISLDHQGQETVYQVAETSQTSDNNCKSETLLQHQQKHKQQY